MQQKFFKSTKKLIYKTIIHTTNNHTKVILMKRFGMLIYKATQLIARVEKSLQEIYLIFH